MVRQLFHAFARKWHGAAWRFYFALYKASVNLTTVVEFDLAHRCRYFQWKTECISLNLYFFNEYFTPLARKDTVVGVFVSFHLQGWMLNATGALFSMVLQRSLRRQALSGSQSIATLNRVWLWRGPSLDISYLHGYRLCHDIYDPWCSSTRGAVCGVWIPVY